MKTIHIDIYGPPAAGKTMMLASWYHTMPPEQRLGIKSVSTGILEQIQNVLGAGGVAPPAELDDGDSVNHPSTSPRRDTKKTSPESDESVLLESNANEKGNTLFKIRSYAGELTLSTGSVDTEKFKSRFDDGDRLLVIALNPFTSHKLIADQGLRSMLSYLQTSPENQMGLGEALRVACQALFSISPDELEHSYAELLALADDAGDCVMTYTENRVGEQRFQWSKFTDESLPTRLDLQFNVLTRNAVTSTLAFRDQVRRAACDLENCAVVLTHMDLLSLMPGITNATFEPVFSEVFVGAVDLRVSQKQYQNTLLLKKASNRATQPVPAMAGGGSHSLHPAARHAHLEPYDFVTSAYRVMNSLQQYAANRLWNSAADDDEAEILDPISGARQAAAMRRRTGPGQEQQHSGITSAGFATHLVIWGLSAFCALFLLLLVGNVLVVACGGDGLWYSQLIGTAVVLSVVVGTPMASIAFARSPRVESLRLRENTAEFAAFDRGGASEDLAAIPYENLSISHPWILGSILRTGWLGLTDNGRRKRWMLKNVDNLWRDLRERGARTATNLWWDLLILVALVALAFGFWWSHNQGYLSHG